MLASSSSDHHFSFLDFLLFFVTSGFQFHCPQADTFHCFAKYVSDVASKDPNSRDLVLGPDVFITDAYLNEHQAYYDAFDEFWQANGYPDDTKVTPGVPWTIKFVSLEAKNRFVEFCQALSAALRLTYARPEVSPDEDDEYDGCVGLIWLGFNSIREKFLSSVVYLKSNVVFVCPRPPCQSIR